MIPLWLTREASTPLRDQLSAQLMLGVLSGSIKPGERLPSVRSLARRFHIHPNTVNSAYRKLAGQGWVQTRRGNGVFACVPVPIAADTIDAFASQCVRNAGNLGFSESQLISALLRLAAEPVVPSLLVVDPDPELARIIAMELREAGHRSVDFTGTERLAENLKADSVQVVTTWHAPTISPLLKGRSYRTVKLRSVPEILAGLQRPAPDALIAIVSRSTVIRNWAQTLLPALGVAWETIVFRNPSDPGWTAGLKACSLIAADIVAATELPPEQSYFALRLVSVSSVTKPFR